MCIRDSIIVCPNETCPLAPNTLGNTTFVVEVFNPPSGNTISGGFDDSSIWEGSTSYTLDVNSAEEPESSESSGSHTGCAIINITRGGTATTSGTIQTGQNEGNVTVGNCSLLRVSQQNDNCGTLPSELILIS